MIVSGKKYIGFTLFLLTLFFVSSSYVDAQTHTHKNIRHHYASYREHVKMPEDTLSPLVKAYIDSLAIYRSRLDLAMTANDSLRKVLDKKAFNNAEYSQLLSPLTFYHRIADNEFSLQSPALRQQMISDAMLNVYLNHPELVVNSEAKLPALIAADVVTNTPVKQDDYLTDVAPEADYNDMTFDENMNLTTTKPNFWTFKGEYSLQFMQNYFSGNWYKGGDSYYSMLAATALQVNYDDRGKIKWENKLEMKLGFMTSPSDSINNFKSTEDLIRLTTKLGIQAHSKWYYTLQAIGSTQFTHGLKSNDTKVYSDFMSPFNLNLSLGMEYKVSCCKEKFTGSINLSPLAYNFRYVAREDLATRYSLEEGRHTLHDFGSTMTVNLLWKPSDKFKWETRLYAYTTYAKVEAEWENTFTFQLNKYLAVKLFAHPRFDDSATRDDEMGYFQFKEYFSLGFNLDL